MKDNNDSSIYLNKPEDVPNINRGIELLLRNKKRRGTQQRPKSFRVTFEKVFSLFNREIHFHFDSFIDIRKRNPREKDPC